VTEFCYFRLGTTSRPYEHKACKSKEVETILAPYLHISQALIHQPALTLHTLTLNLIVAPTIFNVVKRTNARF
jgi:hypothetical protein